MEYMGFLEVCAIVRSGSRGSEVEIITDFIGYNCLYGDSHCNAYSSYHIATGNLIKEIRTQSLIPHFSEIDLDAVVLSASTM